MKNLSKKLFAAAFALFAAGFLVLFFYFFSQLPKPYKGVALAKPLPLPPTEEKIRTESEKKTFILYEIIKTGILHAFDFPKSLSHLKEEKGRLSIIQKLIQEGAEVNTIDSVFGWSPLHWAASHGERKIVSLLLERGANVNVEDKNLWTPLHEAVSNSDLKTASLLLERGANVNAEDKNLWTPLHEAVSNSDLKTASLLLERGADVNKKDKNYWSPLELAEKEKMKEAAILLSKYNFSFKLKVLVLGFLLIITGILGVMTLKINRELADTYTDPV